MEEEDDFGCITAAEPAVTYATREFGHSGITYVDEEAEKIDRIPLGTFGEIEADMDEVDAGIEDPEKWIQVDDFWAAMRKEHSWL